MNVVTKDLPYRRDKIVPEMYSILSAELEKEIKNRVILEPEEIQFSPLSANALTTRLLHHASRIASDMSVATHSPVMAPIVEMRTCDCIFIR